MSTSEWSEIPRGLYLFRALHESSGSYVLHVCLKLSDEPWFDQPHTPFYTQRATCEQTPEFWKWAEQNLPIWNYSELIKKP